MTPRIQAVVVLYKMSLQDSPTYRSLLAASHQLPQLAGRIDLYVADNSSAPQSVPAGFVGTYIHNGNNPGLARRYNEALKMAADAGSPWLLTLDQDTTLTVDYLREILALSESLLADTRVVAVLPKLLTKSHLYSPHVVQFRRSPHKVTLQTSGVIEERLGGFNSAAMTRVSALQAIDGYDERYWLDYLDHATFAKLQRNGDRFYVMQSILEHELSQATPETTSPERAANIMRAEQLYFSEHVRGREMIGRKFDLLRQVIGHARRGRLRIAAQLFGYIFEKSA